MNLYLFLILLFTSSLAGCQSLNKKEYNEFKTISSTNGHINYYINSNKRGWWINASLKPDVVKFECLKGINKVEFVTDIDSITFNINVNDTVRFGIVFNKDTAFTEIIGLPKNVNFDEEFKKAHRSRISIAIPEVSELANIIMAISDIGLKDSNMINMELSYHAEVLNWFLPYKNEPIIRHIDSLQKENNQANNYSFYYSIKMNACGYFFNQQGTILQDSAILKWGFYDDENVIEKNLKSIQQFAEKTNFRKFFSNHQLYYDSLIADLKKTVSILNMKEWLESQFPNKIDYYIITFSPLVYGAHSTNSFFDNGFSTAAMFVAPVFHKPGNLVSDQIDYARLLFTEIDHNYVNPVSFKYEDDINYIFSNREKWRAKRNFADLYTSGLEIFNEYITWAVFTLYCYENYSQADLKTSMRYFEKFMEERRGFINYTAFNNALLEIYKLNKDKKKVYELLPDIIKWCSKQ